MKTKGIRLALTEVYRGIVIEDTIRIDLPQTRVAILRKALDADAKDLKFRETDKVSDTVYVKALAPDHYVKLHIYKY